MAVLALSVGAGCGGDDGDASAGSGDAGDGTVSTSSLGKAQFVRQANKACVREKQRFLGRVAAYKQGSAPSGDSPGERYAEEIKAVLLPTVEGEIEAIRKLGAPAGDEERVEEILAAQRQAVDRLAAMESIDSIYEVVRQFDESNELLEQYGLKNCTVVAEPNAPPRN